jgi:hypothetical protein
MQRFRRLIPAFSSGILALALAASSQAAAQGRGDKKPDHVPPGQAKKQVSVSQAITVSKEVLVAQGYRVIAIERIGDVQVIQYRRGNNGNGRGLGPVERMVVKPSGTVVVFEATPPKVLLAINVKLGL